MVDGKGKGEHDMTNNLIISAPSSGTPSVLVWLKEGLEPRKGLFEAVSEGPDLGPVPWSRFDLALSYAMNAPRTDERVPWIKTGERVLRPIELRDLYAAGGETDI
jgi:hypothetical protein